MRHISLNDKGVEREKSKSERPIKIVRRKSLKNYDEESHVIRHPTHRKKGREYLVSLPSLFLFEGIRSIFFPSSSYFEMVISFHKKEIFLSSYFVCFLLWKEVPHSHPSSLFLLQ